MRKRTVMVVAGVTLCAGGLAIAQDPQREIRLKADTAMIARADMIANHASGQIALTGDVSIQANGVIVRADRALVNQREITLEGNVRMTLPPPK